MIGYDEDACLNCVHDDCEPDEFPCNQCISGEDMWSPKG